MAALKAENTILAQMIILLFETEIICSAYRDCSTVGGPHTYSFHHSSPHVTWHDLICFAFGVIILQWDGYGMNRDQQFPSCECSSFCSSSSISIRRNYSETNVCRILPATTRERVSTRLSKLHIHIAYDPNNPDHQYRSHSLLLLELAGSMGPSVLSYPKWVFCSISLKSWVSYLKNFYL